MKTNPILAILVSLILALVIFYSLPVRTANAAPVAGGEQYLVVAFVRGQTDQQFEAQLNALGAEGWRVRCSVPNGVIVAR